MANDELKRADRVADMVRAELMNLLLTGAVHDPGIEGALVSNVRLSDDLRSARVYVRLLDTNVSEPKKKALVRCFQRAGGFLRREIGRRVKLKYTPELRFFWDEGVDHALQMEALLDEVRDDGEGTQE